MKNRAFTLMEMLIVLAIISLVFVGSFVGFSSLNSQQALNRPFEDLRSMAKAAWQRALIEQRAWQIRFYKDRFVLEPKQASNDSDRAFFQAADKAMQRGSGVESITVPPEVMMEVSPWRKGWIRPGDGGAVTWVFEHSGLCEPISVRFTSEDAGTVGARFDPLTASVVEEIYDRDGQ